MVQRTMLGIMADDGRTDGHHQYPDPDEHLHAQQQHQQQLHHHQQQINNNNNNIGDNFGLELKTEPFHSTPTNDLTTLPMIPQEAEPGICAGCGGKILDRYYLMAVDKQWHASCLRCSDCQLPLDSEATCFARDGSIFCKEDYYRRFATKTCARCQLTIAANELVMRARDNVYHLNCFTCASCNKLLTTGEHFGMRHHFVYCRMHYELMLQDHGTNGGGMEFLPESSPVFTDLQIPPQGHPPQQPFYNGTGASQKGRPRKRKSPGPGSLPDSDPTMQQLGLGPNENEMLALGHDGYLMQPSRQKRMRTSFKHHQLRIMKSYFSLNHNPDAKDLKQLAQKTGLSKRVLQVWFQNARAKHRRSVMKQDGDKPPSEQSGHHSDNDCMTHGSNSNSATDDVLAELSDSKSPSGMSDMGSTVSLSELHTSAFDPEDVKPPVSSNLTELFSSSLHAMT